MKKNIFVYALLVLVAMAIGFGAVYFLKKKGAEEPAPPVSTVLPEPAPAPKEEVEAPARPVITEPAQTVVETTVPKENTSAPEVEAPKEEAPAAPVVIISSAQVKAMSENSFKVSGLKAKGASESGVTYELFDREKHKYFSETGDFEDIEPNSAGSYYVRAIDKETQLISQVRTLKGFSVQKPIDRLSASDLTAVFNTGNAGELDDYRAKFVDSKRCRVTCNLSEITTLSQVFQAVSMDGLTATVTDIRYDATGKITSLSVSLE